MTTNLTQPFLDGYNAQDAAIDNPYLWSSDSWLAYRAGATFAKRGTSRPLRAWKGRGYSINVETGGGTRFVVKATTADLGQLDVYRP